MELIQDSVQRFLNKMKSVGYSRMNIAAASGALHNLIQAHPNGNEAPLDPKIADRHVSELEKLVESDAVGRWVMSKNVWFVRKYLDFLKTGNINADRYTKPLLPLEKSFEAVIQTYVDEVSSTEQQKNVVRGHQRDMRFGCQTTAFILSTKSR